MKARELLAEGRLSEALANQQICLEQAATPAAQLFLFEMLVLADRLRESNDLLTAIESHLPNWPAARRRFGDLLRAIRKRNRLRRRPEFLLDPPPHATRRWNAARSVEAGDPDRGVRWIDRADAVTPEVKGFVDGREFVALRDGDERFASVWEVFVGSRYVWVPFEQTRAVVLSPAAGVLDIAYRPAEVRLNDGRSLSVMMPLVYPLSAEGGDEFALGEAVDWTTEDQGPVCAFGAKLFFVGEEELPLSDVRMIEVRG